MAFHPTGIFEVHLPVKDRLVSAEFYQRVLGFSVATHIDRRDITFLWLNGSGSVMLGLWGPACPDPPVSRGLSHFALSLPVAEIEEAPGKLLALGVAPLGFDGQPATEPIILGWMPAISVYFKDPDGHSLEFIHMLDEVPKPDAGVVPLSEWRRRS